MKLYFLSADQPLTKRIYKDSILNTIEKSSYPNVAKFTSHLEEYTNIEELGAVLTKHARLMHCVIKGMLDRSLTNESRRNMTDKNAFTRLLIIDVDADLGITSPKHFIEKYIPELKDVSYVVQYSSSQCLTEYPRFHLFFILTEATSPLNIKLWMRNLNIDNNLLTELTADGFSLKWPIDITVNQNDKLIYIAPPILSANLEHLKKDVKGIEVVINKKPTFTFPSTIEPLPYQSIIENLRSKKNLPKRTPKIKVEHNQSYLSNPDLVEVTGIKDDGDFVRLNLNGGDSWAYWHPKDNPYYLYSFKDDTVTRIKDIAPQYWATLNRQQMPSLRPDQDILFRDIDSDNYFAGCFDDDFKSIGVTGIPGWCHQVGIPPLAPSEIPSYKFVFNPSAPIFNPDKKYPEINTYHKPQFEEPKTYDFNEIKRVVMHFLNNDEHYYNKLINWLACIVQNPSTKHRTAWLFHGTEGTGKGYFFNKVLKPILGREYCHSKTIVQLDDQFNSWMEKCILLFLDEFKFDQSKGKLIVNQLKGLITEPDLNIRKMRQDPNEQYKSYVNIIIASNEDIAIFVNDQDRRYHIPPRQEKRLDDIDTAQIKTELAAFYYFLNNYQTDYEAAQVVEVSEAKAKIIDLNKTSVRHFFLSLYKGDMDYFTQLVGEECVNPAFVLQKNKYETSVRKWIRDKDDPSARLKITDIMNVYTYMINSKGKDMSINKFITMMRKEVPQFDVSQRRIKGTNDRAMCVDVTWTYTEELLPNASITSINTEDYAANA